MFCAGRVVEEDLKRTMKACGGAIQTSVNNMTDGVLGRCELFEEQQIGGERYVKKLSGHFWRLLIGDLTVKNDEPARQCAVYWLNHLVSRQS